MRSPEFQPQAPAPSIFMVDDDEADRVLFRKLIAEAGTSYPLQQFPSGEAAIDAFISVLRGAPAPLVCFLDVRMSGMNGFDVLRWIRCQRTLEEVPVVMLSSSEEPQHFQEALHFGAQCYTAKFPPVVQLREILHEAEAVAAASRTRPFKLPCNLLFAMPHVTA